MKCKIDGCNRESMYTGKQLCQKHYFRIMRNGHHELLSTQKIRLTGSSRKYKRQNPAGYFSINEPDHPLADSTGYVYEHRFLIYEKYGEKLPDCELCGKPTNWNTCHIDHIDEDVTNNKLENLRPLCRPCNTTRTERSGVDRMEYMGRNLTFTQWSKETGVTAGRNQIRARFKKGFSPHDALFMENITHPKK